MSESAAMGPLSRLAMGAVFAAIGLVILLASIGVIATNPEDIKVPRWVFSLSGLAFICMGGAIALADAPAGSSFARRAAAHAFPLAFVGLLGVMMGWVAFGEGPRHFEGQTSFFGITIGDGSDEAAGRVGFGAIAVLSAVVFVFGVAKAWRELRRR